MTWLSVWTLLDLAVGLAFLAASALIWPTRARPPAVLLGLTGVTWFLGNLAALPGLAGSVAAAGTYLHRGPVTQLVVTLPTGRPRSRAVGGLVLVGYAVAAVPALARSETVTLLVAAALVGVTLRSGRWSVDRLPVMLAVVALAVPATIRLVLPVGASGAALVTYDGTLVLLAAVLAARLHRSPRADVADLVVRLVQGTRAAPTETLRDALARTVGDPTLQLAFPVAGGYVDARGAVVTLDPSPGRSLTALVRDGRTVGLLAHDPAVLNDPALVDAVATAAALTSANARLRAGVERQVEEVRMSRRRLVTAAMDERRRLEAELRRGAGARLDRVAELLERLPPMPEVGDAVAAARNQVTGARADLVDLAGGLHPSTVRSAGLATALEELARSAPIPVSVRVSTSGFPDEVAATAFYVCAEALTNVARHSLARSGVVRIDEEDGSLLVTVTDDGAGGADPSGSGLRGLADRVEALGGELTITNDRPGTRLTARLPLGF